MENKNNKSYFYWVISIALILSLAMSFMSFGKMSKMSDFEVDEDLIAQNAAKYVLASLPEVAEMPSAEDIASLVPKVEVPDVYEEMHDLWEGLYPVEIAELENNSESDARLELEDDYFEALEDFLKVEIEGFDEISDVDEKDMEIEILQYGFNDNDDDKEADVYFKLKVYYELLDGEDDDFKKYVYAHYNVLYDEGDFSDEDVSLVNFSFEAPEIFA